MDGSTPNKSERPLGGRRDDFKKILEIAHRQRPTKPPEEKTETPTWIFGVGIAVFIVVLVSAGWIGLTRKTSAPIFEEVAINQTTILQEGDKTITRQDRLVIQSLTDANPELLRPRLHPNIKIPQGWKVNIDTVEHLEINRNGSIIMVQVLSSQETKQSMTNKIVALIKDASRAKLAWVQPKTILRGEERWTHFEGITITPEATHYAAYFRCSPPQSLQIIVTSPQKNIENDKQSTEQLFATLH